MKAFLVGLVFLIAVVLLSSIGILFFPLLIAMVWFLRLILIGAFVIFAIWLLGKFIIWVWGKLKK